MKAMERCYRHLLGQRHKMAQRMEAGMKGDAQIPGWPYPYTRERNIFDKGKANQK